MRLDVIIPTYNRSGTLARAIHSLFAAEIPPQIVVRVAVINNNSTDDTEQVVRSCQAVYRDRLLYFNESVQGRSAALNRGILETDSDLIGMVDDDEEVDPRWFRVVCSVFTNNPETGFIGGPYIPPQDIVLPAWVPRRSYRGVIGWMENGSREYAFTENSPILLGGNAVVRREVFQAVGLYNPHLGRSKQRLMSMEDQDMYQRLLKAGVKGLYIPGLIIYHHIPPERLTRSYHRRWCYWTGVSVGIQERCRPSAVACLGRIPRYRIKQAMLSAVRAVRGLWNWNDPDAFARELDLWLFVGIVVGLYFWRVRTDVGQKSAAPPYLAHTQAKNI